MTKKNRPRKSMAKLEDFIRDGEGRALEAAYKLAGNREEARELVQEAMFRIVRSWDRFDESRPIEAWFLTILRNLFYDTRRAADRRAVSLDGVASANGEWISLAEVIPSDEKMATEALIALETQAEVRRTLRTLRKEQRAILKACDIDGMRYREVATMLGLPEGTIRSRLSRARAAFRTAYQE